VARRLIAPTAHAAALRHARAPAQTAV
jgi:hypothetical protein